MDKHGQEGLGEQEEMSEERWRRVYAAVLVTTVAVISALWFFSRYFSR